MAEYLLLMTLSEKCSANQMRNVYGMKRRRRSERWKGKGDTGRTSLKSAGVN